MSPAEANGKRSGVAGVLSDPTLTLRNKDGVVVAANDDWKNTQQAEIVDTGIPPTNDLESAIVTILPSGNYTAIVSGLDGGTGVGLVEVYNLQ